MLTRLLVVVAIVVIATIVGWFIQRRDGRLVAEGELVDHDDLIELHLPHDGADEAVPNRAVLVGSPTCGPCDAVKRVLAEVEAARGDFTWRYIDAADHLELMSRLRVRRVPTLLVMDGRGRVVARSTGIPSPAELHAVFDEGAQLVA